MDANSAGPTTTERPATEALAAFIGGFVCAEGTFGNYGNPPSFTFAVRLGASDSDSCERLRWYFGVGHVHTYPRRKAHYDDEVGYAVGALGDLVDFIVPFMDEHLPPSYKRRQYEVWREALLNYWMNGARRRGRAPCTVPGCTDPQRAKGLCRCHYYGQYGK